MLHVAGPPGVPRRRFLGKSIGLASVAAGGALLASCSSAGSPTNAGVVEEAEAIATAPVVDVGFLRDMAAYHGQALVMCQRVLGGDVGVPVKAAAAEVLQNQAIELGMMRAWLADWGVSTAPPEFVMSWMGMGEGEGMPLRMMPGLATDAELQELSQLQGIDQGRAWLELMTVHHQGGVAMAEAAAHMATTVKVVRLAKTQAAVQTYEISQYEQLLATTYAR